MKSQSSDTLMRLLGFWLQLVLSRGGLGLNIEKYLFLVNLEQW